MATITSHPTPVAQAGHTRPGTIEDYHDRIFGVIRHIRDHLDDDITADGLARVAHFSKFHFQRIFQGMIGETVQTFVRRIRLERAAVDLRKGDQTVLTIARRAGYTTQEAFTRAFREHFGLPPAVYRESGTEVVFSASPTHVHFGQAQWYPAFLRYEELGAIQRVGIDRLPERHVATISHRGDYLALCSAGERLLEWASNHALLRPNAACCAIFHDNPQEVPEADLRSEACIEVPLGTPPDTETGIEIKTIPGGLFVSALFKGHPHKLHQAYPWLFGRWMPEHGHVPAEGPCYQVYLLSPFCAPEQEMLTSINIPIVEK
ncbi:MAG: AraC family transcriptional regulator [Phycisphaeraceae bacterium]|nr:AraC family transcriptional regulator [Phycisphaeraceae bacterium]